METPRIDAPDVSAVDVMMCGFAMCDTIKVFGQKLGDGPFNY